MRATKGGWPASSSTSSSSSTQPRRTSVQSSPWQAPGGATPSDTGASASSSPSAAPGASTATATTTTSTAPALGRLGGPPLVLTPVSQAPRGPRRQSRTQAALAAADKVSKYDPDYYNPDGSLRKIHDMPQFELSYAQAGQARYIRPKEKFEREQELTIKQIFEKD